MVGGSLGESARAAPSADRVINAPAAAAADVPRLNRVMWLPPEVFHRGESAMAD